MLVLSVTIIQDLMGIIHHPCQLFAVLACCETISAFKFDCRNHTSQFSFSSVQKMPFFRDECSTSDERTVKVYISSTS